MTDDRPHPILRAAIGLAVAAGLVLAVSGAARPGAPAPAASGPGIAAAFGCSADAVLALAAWKAWGHAPRHVADRAFDACMTRRGA